MKSSVHCGYNSIGQTFLAGERRKKKSLDWYTEMYVFVNNFVHFTFQALKLEKWTLPNMIKDFLKISQRVWHENNFLDI